VADKKQSKRTWDYCFKKEKRSVVNVAR